MSPIVKRKGEKFTLPGKYLLFILTILCTGLIVLTFHTNILSAPASAVGGFLITPMQEGISKVGSWLHIRSEELVQIRTLLKENEELKSSNENLNKKLNSKQHELDEIVASNRRTVLEKDEKIGEIITEQQYNKYAKIFQPFTREVY